MVRFEVTGETTFHASHHLIHYRGTSETPHEHNYRLNVVLEVDRLDYDDISVDFIELDRILNAIKAHFDNCNINEITELSGKNSTAENLALTIGDMLNVELNNAKNTRLKCVEIWELSNMSVRVCFDP